MVRRNFFFFPFVGAGSFGISRAVTSIFALVLAVLLSAAIGVAFSPAAAAQTAHFSGAESTIDNALGQPFGAAVDASGNVFIAAGSVVYQETPALSGNGYVLSTLFKGFGTAQSVAVDGAGNLYIADYSTGIIYKATWSGSSFALAKLISGFNQPDGLAVDGSGDLVIASQADQAVYLETLSGGNYTQSTAVSGFAPVAEAVDGSGNLYLLEDGSSSVNANLFKETLSGGSYTQSTISNSLDWVEYLAVDAVGNVYVTTQGTNCCGGANSVFDFTPLVDGSYGLVNDWDSGFNGVTGVAVDGKGNVFVDDCYTNCGAGGIEYKLDVADPPSLSFASTAGEATSTDSPKTVTVTNSGTAPLTFSAISYPADFPESAEGVDDCIATTTLAAGESCPLTIDFSPVAVSGTSTSLALSESVKITTNTLNAVAKTQSISVSGTETKLTPSVVVTASANPAPISSAVTFTATATAPLLASPTPTGTVTFYVDRKALGTAVSLNGGVASVQTSSLTAGPHTVFAVYSGDAVEASGTSSSITEAVQQPQTITFTAPAPATYGATVNLATYAKATSGLAVSFSVISGPATLSGSTLKIAGVGTVVVAANQAGNSSYAAAATVQQSITTNKAVLTVTANNLSMKQGSAVPTLTYTLSGFKNGDTQTAATKGAPTLSTTATSSSPVGTYPITVAQGTLTATNYGFTLVNGTLTVKKAK